jgi:hypothetical protein
MTAYGEFRLRILPGSRPGFYRVETSGLGGDGEGRFKLPFSEVELENFVLKVGRTRRGVRKIESPEMQLARKFGGQLFAAVMQGKTGELYRAASSEARATGQGLRITLSLADVPELGQIPWEYLFDDPNFLSINTWTPVVRYLDLPRPRRALEIELPLRILGIICAPSDAQPLNVESEKAKLEQALKPLKDAGAVAIDWVDEPTLLGLTRKVRPDKYHILHFIGHGGFDNASGEGALLFEDEDGRGRTVSGDQLAQVLYGKRSLRLVLLNSCEGARNGVQDPFSGVAASLVEREIPAVIGMQFEITDRTAVLFAGEFYTMLAEGSPIDSAISEARLAIWADSNDVEWGTPVLFMRVADGRLFDVVHATALPRLAPEDLPPKPEPATEPAAPAEPAEPAKPEPLEPTEPEPLEPDEPEPIQPAEPEPEAWQPDEPEPLPPAEPEPAEPEPLEPVGVGRGGLGPAGVATPDKPKQGLAQPDVAQQGVGQEDTGHAETGGTRWGVTRRTAAGAIGVAAAIVLLLVAIRLLLPPTSTGSLSVSTDGTLQTGLVFLSGSGFAGGEPVDIYLDGAPATTIEAEADGSFEGELTVGTQRTGTVSAVGRNSHNEANTDFNVEVAGGSGSPPASDGATPGASESGSANTQPVPPGILFYSDVEPGSSESADQELYLIDPLTKVVTQLTHNDVNDTFPTWSPDYTQIAFSRGDVRKRDILIRDLHGKEESARPLVAGATDDWFPAWSKNGLVAFARAGPTGVDSATLWVIKSDGTEEAAREVLPGVHGRAPAWSKDGTTLAFMSERSESKLDVAIVGADGTGLEYLTSGTSDDRNPTWSPNGPQLAGVSDVDGDQEIYLLDVATRAEPTQLTFNDVLDGNPVWSPDGKEIAFYRETSDRVYHLFKINLETGKEDDLMPNALGQNMDPNWR